MTFRTVNGFNPFIQPSQDRWGVERYGQGGSSALAGRRRQMMQAGFSEQSPQTAMGWPGFSQPQPQLQMGASDPFAGFNPFSFTANINRGPVGAIDPVSAYPPSRLGGNSSITQTMARMPQEFSPSLASHYGYSAIGPGGNCVRDLGYA